jgi:formylglycine-generating enzyme required for sulfatase activity
MEPVKAVTIPETPVPDLVLVPGGTFPMGKNGSRKDEQPAHRVSVAAFRAAVSPLTNAEYAAFLAETGGNPPPFLGEERFAAPEQPVVGINWFEATAYCEWLTARTGARCRLPTEAEREWAALGGPGSGDWPWHGEEHPLAAELSAMDRPHAPRPECANGYGLRCMAENVHEWCSDWYAGDYYAVSPVESPRGAGEGKRRASRGGSWRHSEKFTRINARSSLAPGFRYSDFGFRVYGDA